MIVQRLTVTVESFKDEEFKQLFLDEKQVVEAAGLKHVTKRLYKSFIGAAPRDTWVVENEFEDLADREQWWAAWLALETTPEFGRRWRELLTSQMVDEVWFVEEV